VAGIPRQKIFKQVRIETIREVKHFVREIEQKSNMIGFSISTPVSIKFKIDFEAEDDEGAVNKEQIQQ